MIVASNETGKCPVCNGELEYGHSEVIDGQYCYEWVCTECGTSGKEWHNLVFASHTLGCSI